MTLEEELLDAHARDDRRALVTLYARAADLSEGAGKIDAACFYLTHAYIYGLEMAHPDTGALRDRLVDYGRETDPG